jgi:hypothetical protein
LFDWKLDDELAFGTERRVRSRLCIRGFKKDDPSRTLIEPIGAVCAAQTGNVFTHSRCLEAAGSFGLPLDHASRISAAVNDRTWTGKEGERSVDEGLESLRQEIARAVGLRL